MNLDQLKFSASIFIPLLLFTLGYIVNESIKRKARKSELKSKLIFLYELLHELRENIRELPSDLGVVNQDIVRINLNKTDHEYLVINYYLQNIFASAGGREWRITKMHYPRAN